LQCLFDRGRLTRVDARERVLAIDTDAQTIDALPDLIERARHRIGERRRVPGVMTGHDVVHDRHVHDAARHRADVIERLGECQHAKAADAAVGGLEADHAVGGRRKANRPAGIGANRAETETRGRGHAGATGG
jgi:hypothetical protein